MTAENVQVLEIGMFDEEAEFKTLTLSHKSYFNWAENFSVASLIYLKNIMFFALIFVLHC
jgi:hypothetical protein